MLYRGLRVMVCDCGVEDGNHAPDCAFVRSSDEIESQFREHVGGVVWRFCEALRERLTPQMFQQMLALNAAESNPHVCHSHDFCDANVFMEEAISEAGVSVGVDHPYHSQVWREAWKKAKASGFSL